MWDLGRLAGLYYKQVAHTTVHALSQLVVAKWVNMPR